MNLESHIEKNAKYFFIILIIFYMIQSLILLDKYILPWGDEAMFTTAAKSFADTGKIKCDYVIGQEEGVYWQPPLYFIAVAGFIKLFGFGLEQVRIFSIITSVVLLGFVLQISRKIFNSNKFTFLVLVLVIFDPLFLRFSKIGRMDVLTLLWILSSFYFYFKWIETQSKRHLAITSLFSLFAVSTHPLGLIAPVSLIIHSFFKKYTHSVRSVFIITILAPLLLFGLIALIYILQNQSSSFEQIAFQFGRKGDRAILDSILSFFARYRVLPGVLIIIILGFWSLFLIVKNRLLSSYIGLIGIGFIVSLVIIVINFELFYSLYFFIFAAILFTYLFQNIPKKFIMILNWILIFWFINVSTVTGYFNYFYLVKANKETDVKLFTKNIINMIPINSTVAIEGYPNLYWTLKDRADLKIISPIILSERRIAELTGTTDYLIIASAFRYSEDKEYVNRRVLEITDLFSKNHAKLEMAGNFGNKMDYMCRADLYKIVRLKK
jgi:4-amino-4-deoxy-L-arabinose transferase-like glycosyltransferase